MEAGVTAVLVTGARGYLGGRLVQALATDMRVTGTSRGAASPPPGWPANARLLPLDPATQDEATLAAALKGQDAVMHLAAPNEIESAADPAGSLVSGGVATVKLLRAAIAAGCKRFVFLSTIHVYGAPLPGRIDEATPANPSHSYAVIHRTAEDFVRAAHARGEIEGVVLRLSNGIGAPAWPGVDRWTVIGNDLCRQAVETGRVVLRSSGLQWRDFILLPDFTRAVRHVLELPRPTLGDGVFNLGGRLPLRMLDVAELVAARSTALLGRDILVQRPEPAPGERYPTIDFVIDKLAATGFTPSPAAALADEIDATLRLCRAAFGVAA